MYLSWHQLVPFSQEIIPVHMGKERTSSTPFLFYGPTFWLTISIILQK